MTFREFIASHRQVVAGRPADLRSPDFDILHAIEFARRHPEADTLDGLLGAARAELRIVERMPPGIYVELGPFSVSTWRRRTRVQAVAVSGFLGDGLSPDKLQDGP